MVGALVRGCGKAMLVGRGARVSKLVDADGWRESSRAESPKERTSGREMGRLGIRREPRVVVSG
jgi:hypothetical protein